MKKLGERMLLACCRHPDANDYPGGTVLTTVENALEFLDKTVPNFRSLLHGRVLDFGCGWGHQAVAMALSCNVTEVVGLDIQWHERARRLAEDHNCSDRVHFVERLEESDLGSFDVVLSCSSMEHFSDPAGAVALMKNAAKPGGLVIISFAEPWYGPRGSHFDAYSRLPWVNLMFREDTVMKARSRFRNDGAQRYEEVQGGLNRMSIAKFERIIRGSGMQIEFFKVYITKGLPLLDKVPIARELLAAAAAVTLRKVE
jgi:SAM-dependent methyltransferase